MRPAFVQTAPSIFEGDIIRFRIQPCLKGMLIEGSVAELLMFLLNQVDVLSRNLCLQAPLVDLDKLLKPKGRDVSKLVWQHRH